MEILQYKSRYYISMSNIQQTLGLDDRQFEQTVDRYSLSKKTLEMKDNNISCKSACNFLSWYMDCSYDLLPNVANFRHSLTKYTKKIPKRVLSRSHRIEIAFRQKYACNFCNLFPIPPTFEVDHIDALEDGGQDIASNLQALCVPCHREKTRLNRLRKHSLFRDEASVQYDVLTNKQQIQETTAQTYPITQNIFSKYFSKE
jgi:hypothetical protein